MKDKVYLIFGDSIVYGYGDDEAFGWVNRFKKHFDKRTFILNLGVPGDKSGDILKRFKNEVVSRYNKEDDFTIIFSFGINDAKRLKDNPNYLEVFKNNLDEVIKEALEFTSNIIILGILYVDLTIRSYIREEDIRLIDKELKDISIKRKLTYIDMQGVINKEDLADGLHPNSVGHEKISRYVYEYIKNII